MQKVVGRSGTRVHVAHLCDVDRLHPGDAWSCLAWAPICNSPMRGIRPATGADLAGLPLCENCVVTVEQLSRLIAQTSILDGLAVERASGMPRWNVGP